MSKNATPRRMRAKAGEAKREREREREREFGKCAHRDGEERTTTRTEQW